MKLKKKLLLKSMTGDSETGHSGRHSPELQGREGPVDRTAGGDPTAED